MAKSNDTISKTLIVAFLLCIVCAVVVAGSAVALKPQQVKNKELDRRSNILLAAGLLEPNQVTADKVTELFKKVTVKAVDLRTGEFTDAVNTDSYNQMKAASDPDMSKVLKNDPAGIKRRENISLVYLIGNVDHPDKIILPVRGYGLWSTMYGFLALEGDANTVAGFGFYQQGETPGLGGEVDNPNWKALWPGKEIYADNSMDPEIHLVKGGVSPQTPNAENKVDALAGATLTSRGVTHLLQYWLGRDGFGPFLEKYRSEGA